MQSCRTVYYNNSSMLVFRKPCSFFAKANWPDCSKICTKVWYLLLSPFTALCRWPRNFSAFLYGSGSPAHSLLSRSDMSWLLRALGRSAAVFMLLTSGSKAILKASDSAAELPAPVAIPSTQNHRRRGCSEARASPEGEPKDVFTYWLIIRGGVVGEGGAGERETQPFRSVPYGAPLVIKFQQHNRIELRMREAFRISNTVSLLA